MLFLISLTISLGQGNLISKLEKQKVELEAYVSDYEDKMKVLVKVADEDELREVLDQQLPENTEVVYHVLKNTYEKVVYVGEYPQSQSGDWTLEVKHYFSGDGQLIAFEKRLTYFGDECVHGAVIEKQTELYDNSKIISSTTILTDDKGNRLDAKKCGHSYDWKFDKRTRIDELMKLKESSCDILHRY